MGEEKKNLKNRINKAMKRPVNREQGIQEPLKTPNDQPQMPVINAEEKGEDKARRKLLDKPIKIFGVICLAVTILALVFSGSTTPDTSESAKNALKNRISTAISAGTILLSNDENAAAKDYTIAHKSGAKDTKIWVWDYAAEDGDYVQVLVNGTPVTEGFMIRHKPKEILVPAAGEVQIKGIRDGGGGITYAVRYEVNGTSYFNGTPEGQFNTYTLTSE